jgi:hypothetical protein
MTHGLGRQWTPMPHRIRDTFEIETYDDLIDSLERLATAQDYPPPEPFHDGINHSRDRHSQFNDLRSLTVDANLDDPPVPGYRDLPQGANLNYAQQITQTSPPHGRRRPQPQIRQTSRHPHKSRQRVQSSR